MFIKFGYKIEDATETIWKKTSVIVVEVGETVRGKVEDVIGEEALQAAGEAGIKIRDGSIKAWEETLEFEEKAREKALDSKAGDFGRKLGNRWKNRREKNEEEDEPEMISLAAKSISDETSKFTQEDNKYQILIAITFAAIVLLSAICAIIFKMKKN